MFKFGRQTGAKQVNNGLILQPLSEMRGEIKFRGGRLVQRVAKTFEHSGMEEHRRTVCLSFQGRQGVVQLG